MQRTLARNEKIAGIGDDAVLKKTGKTWAGWFKILDAAGARKMLHSEIATHLADNHKLDGWWAQMVAVGYEQARGLRKKYETLEGYKISRSVTVAVPLKRLYNAWSDVKLRDKWLQQRGLTIRRAMSQKSMRITWVDGTSSIEVNFYAKGDSKSQVVV